MKDVQNNFSAKPAIDFLTAMAIATVAICLVQFFHEGTHALMAVLTGAQLQEFSALHVGSESQYVWQSKIISGSASLINLFLGLWAFFVLRNGRSSSPHKIYFLWLFMVMNWLLGAGYWMFSGIANVGDWAQVIEGWQPAWIWRLGMAVAGTMLYMGLVWLALRELGRKIGGKQTDEQISRAVKLGLSAYLSIFLVILIAGVFNPHGITGLPAVAAMMLALGGMSPLLWMMQWFRAEMFAKPAGEALVIPRHIPWIIGAGVSIFLYSIVLGLGIRF